MTVEAEIQYPYTWTILNPPCQRDADELSQFYQELGYYIVLDEPTEGDNRYVVLMLGEAIIGIKPISEWTGSTLYNNVPNVWALYEDLLSRNVKIDEVLTDQPWGDTTFAVYDRESGVRLVYSTHTNRRDLSGPEPDENRGE